MVDTIPIQATITFQESTLEELERLIPESNRTAFINNAVVEALQQISKEKVIDALQSSQIEAPVNKSSVEILRYIRQKESERLVIKSMTTC